MIQREAEVSVRKLAKHFRSVAVVGPRQSGKTTLVQKVFANKPYASLENPDERQLASSDPRAFLARFPKGAILDEAQRAPRLFSYLQAILDKEKRDGMFILTGSNNFLLQQGITQTLAGRIGYLDLLPLSVSEIHSQPTSNLSTDKLLLNGCYPEIYDKDRKPSLWYPAYIRTYVERDVKQIRNIENTLTFNRFLKLCAGRIGQMLNVASLSNECGVDIKTTQSWLSILSSSYVIFLLSPHHKNFNKRVVKTPKLYFYDTGLACSLLGIDRENEISNSHFRGALFENLIVVEWLKRIKNRLSNSELFYWRDNKGVEIDLIVDDGKNLIPVEIKSSQTYHQNFLKNLTLWNSFSGAKGGLLLYDGNLEFKDNSKIEVFNWRNLKPYKTIK
ncbi:MAG: ATP-binding protein [Cyclobacteriaceae bacterium]